MRITNPQRFSLPLLEYSRETHVYFPAVAPPLATAGSGNTVERAVPAAMANAAFWNTALRFTTSLVWRLYASREHAERRKRDSFRNECMVKISMVYQRDGFGVNNNPTIYFSQSRFAIVEVSTHPPSPQTPKTKKGKIQKSPMSKVTYAFDRLIHSTRPNKNLL
jgi:hypothetical protein